MDAALAKHEVAGGITGGSLAGGMQGLEKRDQRRGFRWTQVLAVGRHVAASLNHLADELVLREPNRDTVKRRPSLAARVAERMAVAALLHLKDERALPLQRRPACRNCSGTGSPLHAFMCGLHGVYPARCVNVPKRYCDQQDRQNRNRPPPPALFSLTREKRQKEQTDDHEDGADQ